MKCVKMLGLAAVAAVALMAVAGAGFASATVLCKVAPTGGKCPASQAYPAGTETQSVSETETPALTGGFKTVNCVKSTVVSKNGNEGSATETVQGATEALTFTECNCEVIVVTKGSLEVHVIGAGPNGTLTSTGTKVTVNCSSIFGPVHCIYVTNGTDLGTLTGGSTATIDITAEISRENTSGLCAEEAVWHAKYLVVSPDAVYVAEST